MKVLFDHQCFWEKYGGVSRYFSEILKTNNKDIEYELAIKYSNNEYLKTLPFKYKNFFSNLNVPKKHYIISAINKPHTIRILNQTDANIVHITHYDPYLFKYAKGKKIVSTMHDLNFFAIPEFYREKTNILKKWQQICAERSDFIITISENSKKDLINYLNIPENKIAVVYHGIDSTFHKITEKRLIERPYILFVGRRNGYKNFQTVLKSFEILKDLYKDLCLICTGPDFSKSELETFIVSGLADRIFHFSCSEIELQNLYSNAEFFVFPSFYEGFGFPLLEAMACECPVLCSNTSCFPEIAGKAGLFFEPSDIEELAYKMQQLLDSDDLKKELIKDGLIQKNKFSWDVSREEHLKIYRKLNENFIN